MPVRPREKLAQERSIKGYAKLAESNKLLQLLLQIPDHRKPQGMRYNLSQFLSNNRYRCITQSQKFDYTIQVRAENSNNLFSFLSFFYVLYFAEENIISNRSFL